MKETIANIYVSSAHIGMTIMFNCLLQVLVAFMLSKMFSLKLNVCQNNGSRATVDIAAGKPPWFKCV